MNVELFILKGAYELDLFTVRHKQAHILPESKYNILEQGKP